MVMTSPRQSAGTMAHAPSGSRPQAAIAIATSASTIDRSALPSGPSSRRGPLSITPAMPTNSDMAAKQTTKATEAPENGGNKRERQEESDVRNDIACLVQDA